MKKTSSHILSLIVASGLFAAALFGYGYMHLAIKAAEVAASAAVAVTKNGSGGAGAPAQLYEATALGRAKARSYILEDSQAVKFIESLEDLGTVSGAPVTLSSVTDDGISGKGPFGTVRAHVTSSGSWDNVMKVLQLSEVLPYKSALTSVKLEYDKPAPGDKSSSAQWKLSYDISVDTIADSSAVSGSGVLQKP